MPQLTWMECRLDDVTLGASLCAPEMALAAQMELDAAVADRLGAPRCERCLEESGDSLTLSGSEALCAGCLDAEAGEGPGTLGAI